MTVNIDAKFLSRLRLLSIVEGTSTLLLFGIAMPLKYLADMPLAVRIVGSLHGLLFVCLAIVFLLAIPSMINLSIFVPWDLTFGSGMQTLGALLAILTVGWALNRSEVLGQLAGSENYTGRASGRIRFLYIWIRYVIPVAILMVGIWWVLTDLLHIVEL